MYMGMMHEILPPCMKHGGQADGSAKMLPVRREFHDTLGSGFEHKGIDRPLILKCQSVQGIRNREYDVEIADVEQVIFSRFNPTLFGEGLAFGAMPVSTGVIGDTHYISAIVTNIGVSAQRICPATGNGGYRF